MIFEINTWTSLVFFFFFAVIVSFAILFSLLKSLVIYFVFPSVASRYLSHQTTASFLTVWVQFTKIV